MCRADVNVSFADFSCNPHWHRYTEIAHTQSPAWCDMAFGFGKKWWKRASGISNIQRKVSKFWGIRLSKKKIVTPSTPAKFLKSLASSMPKPKTRKPRRTPAKSAATHEAARPHSPDRQLTPGQIEADRIASVIVLWALGLVFAFCSLWRLAGAVVQLMENLASWVASWPSPVWWAIASAVAGVAYVGLCVVIANRLSTDDGDG